MLNLREEQDVRDRIADLVTNWQIEQRGAIESMPVEGYLDLVQAAAIVSEESGLSLQRWVSATRRAGASWEQIGTALGVTRQAAQKRFASFAEDISVTEQGETEDGDGGGDGEKLVRGVNSFNEVEILSEQGAAGYEVVRAGWAKLFFRPTDHPVENVRVVSLRRGKPIAEMESEGWTHVFSWYPYTYYTRPAT